MKTEDRYLKFVRWSEEDGAYVGYCPDLFRGVECVTATMKNRHIANLARSCGTKLSN